MLPFVLGLLAFALGQQSFVIKCNVPYDPDYQHWGAYRCTPRDITVNVGDNVTILNMRSAAVYTLNTKQRLVDPNTTLSNSFCILGRAGKVSIEIGTLPLGPPASEPGPNGVVNITDSTIPYSSGFLISPDSDYMAILGSGLVIPPPPPVRPDWVFSFAIPGTFQYQGCLDWWINGTITVLPAGQALPQTPANLSAQQDSYFSDARAKMTEYSDTFNIGPGKYQTPSFLNNSEGFKTHIVLTGYVNSATDIYFNGFLPPEFTITEGDTVAFEALWYNGPVDDPWQFIHTVRINVSHTPGWVPLYLDTSSSTAWFAIPDITGKNFTFIPYFPFFQPQAGQTPVGIFDNPNTWLGLGDLDNYEGGEVSIGGFGAIVRQRGYLNYRNITFVRAGTYPFICQLHFPNGMNGTVTVQARARTSTRTGLEVDATLKRLHISHFTVALNATWGVNYASKASFTITSATHGVRTFTNSDGVTRSDPLLVTFVVGFAIKTNTKMTKTELGDFGNQLGLFLANKTWTMDSQWSDTYFASSNNNTVAIVTYQLVYQNSASVIGSSLVLLLALLVSLFH